MFYYLWDEYFILFASVLFIEDAVLFSFQINTSETVLALFDVYAIQEVFPFSDDAGEEDIVRVPPDGNRLEHTVGFFSIGGDIEEIFRIIDIIGVLAILASEHVKRMRTVTGAYDIVSRTILGSDQIARFPDLSF